MFSKFFEFLRRKKLRRLARAKVEALQLNATSAGGAEHLAHAMFDWLDLFWNGHKEKFLIRNINTPELIIYGKYPNIMMKFAQDLKKNGLEIEADPPEKFDWDSYKSEELQLFEKVARESMITPAFDETYKAILAVREERNIEIPIKSIQDVFPYDFLSDLFAYHMRYWELSIKKKLDSLTLKESAE